MPSKTAQTAHGATIAAHVATEIRAEMVRHGETITSAAERFGVAPSGISRKLSGAYALTLADLLGFADWLGIAAADLLARAEAQAIAATKRPGKGRAA